MSYYIDSNGKILTNQNTDDYRRRKIAEAQEQVAEHNRTKPAARAASPARRGSETRAGHLAAHDNLKAKGMSAERLRTLFPHVYSTAPVAQRGAVGGSYRLTR